MQIEKVSFVLTILQMMEKYWEGEHVSLTEKK